MSDLDDSYENNQNFELDHLASDPLDFGGFHLNFGGDYGDSKAPMHCVGCGGTKFQVIESHVVCKKCGTENVNHAMNA